MRVVFDLDDTICRTENRDYANSSEISAVVSKIRELRDTIPGVEIVVHTSRGMASCGGDAEAAEKKNRPTIEAWLREHGIKVDKIIFGKPLADLYVDDKAMSADDFGRAKMRVYCGFSGAKVVRIGRIMVKTAENVEQQAAWYRHAREHYRWLLQREPSHVEVVVPKVHSVTLGKLYMEFIHGFSAVTQVSPMVIMNLLDVLLNESTLEGENHLDGYAEYIESRAESIGLTTDIGDRIRKCECLKRRTFCHGDFSLMNIICTSRGYAFIDPSPKSGMDTWILDAAKLRASLAWLDRILAKYSHPRELLDNFDDYITKQELQGIVTPGTLDAIKLAEESHLIRVWYYAKKLGKQRKERELSNYYHWAYGNK